MIRNSCRRAAQALVALLAMSAIGATPALAQNAVVRGTVTSVDRNEPLAGVNVVISALGISVLTGAQGTYVITIPAARVPAEPLVVTARAIGYRAMSSSQIVRAGEQVVNFALQTDINRLEEVIVTGVMEGVERAKIGFAVGRLTGDDVPVPGSSPLISLQGKVPGVRIANMSGKPGTSPEIMLRGPTSINASGRGQGPLIIVDDIIMNVGNLGELGGLDIESVEVVKGAAGASLYGTRAANGVIQIRTNRGRGGTDGVRFNVRTEVGTSDINIDWGQPENHALALDETGKRFCVVVSGQPPCSRTIDWMTEILRVNNVATDTTRATVSLLYNIPNPTQLRNTYQSQVWPGQRYDLLAQVLTRNTTLSTHVDATGKVGNVSFYVAGEYGRQQGAIRYADGVEVRRGKVNLDYNIRPDLTVAVTTQFSNGTNDLRDFQFGAVFRGSPPGTNQMARDTLGRLLTRTGGSSLRGTTNGSSGLLYEFENRKNTLTSDRFLGGVTARYFPTEWATFEGVIGYDRRNVATHRYHVKGFRTNGIAVTSNTGFNNNGNVSLANGQEESLNASLSAIFRRNLSEDLRASLSFRGIYDEYENLDNSSSGHTLRVVDIYTTSNTATNYLTASSSSQTKNTGLFAGATLDYKDRYILEGSFRYDDSSRFGVDNRWAPFGRVSAVWRVSEEPFWDVGFLNEFRLRASRGTAGTTPRFDAQYEAYSVGATGISLDQAGNSLLKPETTTETEVGTDLELFNRIGVEASYAKGVTRDQILPVRSVAALGFSTQWQNAGTLENTTWEVGVTIPILNNRNLFWQARAGWDRTRTYITKLNVPEFIYSGAVQGSSSFFLMTERTDLSNGFPQNRYGNIWGRKFLTKCSELPETVRSDCGGSGSSYQVNDQGWLVWVGKGNSVKDGITKNLWGTILPGSESPYGNATYLSWGHPIVDRPARGEPGEGFGIQQVLGNVFPDFRMTFTNDIQYKRLTLYALVDATIGQEVWNEGEQWGLFDYQSKNFDRANQTVETAKPVGYGWRVGGTEHSQGIGGFYDLLGPNNYSVETASYAKLREVSLTYKVGAVSGVGDWTLGLIGRNLLTVTNYTGLDPETGVSGGSTGSGFLNAIDFFDYPTLRTLTFTISSRF